MVSVKEMNWNFVFCLHEIDCARILSEFFFGEAPHNLNIECG